jgi:glycosyltransferase involved in cell wall biosynthesis
MKISVIIPVYNVEKYIEQCIQSILSQTLQDFQIIVVNDASPDNSMAIVRYYAEHDNRFLIIENQRNMGQMWTRREGYRQASGDFIVFCDSDDYLPQNALELLYNRIIMDGSDIVVGAFQGIRSNGNMGVIQKPRLIYGTDRMALYKSLLHRELNSSLWGRIFNKKLFDDDYYETFENCTMGEDGILFYQIMARVKKVTALDNIVYFYRFNPSSVSHTNSLNIEKRIKLSLFSVNYIYDYLHKYVVLSDDITLSKIKLLLYLIKNNGWDKGVFYKYITWPEKKEIIKINVLSRYFAGVTLLCNYLILNSRIINKLYIWKWKLKAIIRSIKYPTKMQRGSV